MENKFVEGMWFKKPNEKAPDFVKGNISVHADKFIEWMKGKANEKGYINIVLKKSKEKGILYLQHDDWKPKSQTGEVSVEELPDDF